jgi:hypothetical protein
VDEDGYDDFRLGLEGAGQITLVGRNIVNDNGLTSRCGRATDALIERDTGVRGHGPLERAENEQVAICFFFEHVEVHPVVTRELLMKGGNNSLHEGFGRGGARGEGIQLRNQTDPRDLHVRSSFAGSASQSQGEENGFLRLMLWESKGV